MVWPAAFADVIDQVGSSNVSLLQNSADACEGMTGGDEADRASNGDADGKGVLVKVAVNWFPTKTQHAQPVLPGDNCGAHEALNNAPPTVTDSGVGEVVNEVEVAPIGKSVGDCMWNFTRRPVLHSMADLSLQSLTGHWSLD